MKKFIISSALDKDTPLGIISYSISTHRGVDASMDISEYAPSVEFGAPTFENLIDHAKPQKIDYILVQDIVKEEQDVFWADEDDDRTHTGVYARMLDGTMCHLADFLDREDAVAFKKLVEQIAKYSK